MDPKEAPKNWRIRSKLLGHGLALILCSAIFQAGSSVMESASIIWTKQHEATLQNRLMAEYYMDLYGSL